MKRSTVEAGKSLKNLRALADMTLDQVAASARISPSYLSKVESGVKEASPEWIARVGSKIADHIVRSATATTPEASDPAA